MSKKAWFRLGLVTVIGVGAAVAFQYREFISPEGFNTLITDLGVWGPVVFFLLWLLAPVFFIPGAPLTLAGGALFGPLWGTVYTVFGATGGATLAFLTSRYLAGDWAEKKAKGYLGRIKEGVENEGWRFVAFTRLVPLFPFFLLNYALGLTRIRLGTYVLTSLICMVPGTFAFTYAGYAGREVLAGGENLVQTIIIALAIVGVLIFGLPFVIRRWHARVPGINPAVLEEWRKSGKDMLVLDVRTQEEFTGPLGQLSPSTLIPIDELEQRLPELEAFRDRPMVVV